MADDADVPGVLTREAMIGTRYILGSARRDAIVDHAEILLDGERMRAQYVPLPPLKRPLLTMCFYFCMLLLVLIGLAMILRALRSVLA